MASSAPLVSPEALRSFRHQYLVTHWGKKVLYMVFNKYFLHGHKKSILEILVENDIRCNKKLFNVDEINSLGQKSPEHYDITLMNKICQFLWQKGVNDPGDELKQLVKKIKAERDCVCHEECKMSDNDLADKLLEFKRTLEETLDKTKALLPVHGGEIDQLKAELGVAVQELLRKIREKYDPSESEDMESLKQEIRAFWRECRDQVQEVTQKEFRSLYETLCQISPFDLLAKHLIQDPCNFIISLKVEDDKRFNQNYRGTRGIIVKQHEIFDEQKMGADPEVLILSGDAGSGKTTILCSFVEKWYKKEIGIPKLSSFKALLYMQFRNHDHDNFDDYLKSLLKDTVKRYGYPAVLSYILVSKCLILCDGYDEVNKKSKKLFEEMLTLPWSDVKFVVTTRPWNTEDLTNIVNNGKRSKVNLNVLGLQEKEFNLLIENISGCLVQDDQERNKIKMELSQKIAEMSYRTKVLLKTPLLFNIFIFIYVDSPNLRPELNTRASLYLQLKQNLANKILETTGISEESLKRFDELYRKWSLKYYIEKKFEWTHGDVRSFKEEIRSQISSQDVLENFPAIMSFYFSIKHTYDDLQIVNVYCYVHRSVQEFAIAVDLCDEISVRMQQGGGDFLLDMALKSKGLTDSSVFDNNDLFKELVGVISFLPGILYLDCPNKSDALYNQIKSIQKLYVTYSLSQHTHDELLEPCIETRLDDQVLQSHVSLLEETRLKRSIRFQRADGLFVLPPLLSRLKPRHLDLEEIMRDLSKFNEILEVTVAHKIPTRIQLWIDLKVSEKFSEEVSHSVETLRVDIVNFENNTVEDERYYPLSLMRQTKNLTVVYNVQTFGSKPTSKIVNRSFPIFRSVGASSTNAAFMLTSKDCDIRDLITSLTIAPLKAVGVYTRRENKGFEDLHGYCKSAGLGILYIL